MKKIEPEKKFLIAPGTDGNCSCSNCPFMELNTMEKLKNCLQEMSPQILMENELILRAKNSLNTMLKLS